MAVLKVFFDASRSASGPPLLAVAGYIAPGYHWDHGFVPPWQRALRKERLAPKGNGRPGYYHATDAEWPFHGIYKKLWGEDKDRAVTFKQKLLKIIESSAIFGVGAAVSLEPPTENHVFAYQMCVKSCIESLITSDLVPPDKMIIPVFEDGDGVKGELQWFCKLLRSHPRYARLGPESFGDKIQYPPLQAADMLAFEVMKRCAHKLTHAPHQRRIAIELTSRVATEAWYYAPPLLKRFIEDSRRKPDGSIGPRA